MNGADLDEADRILRLSFGTFLELEDPMSFFGDKDYVRTRFRAAPTSALAAEINGKFVGSNFIAKWGSVGIFGPLSVHPDYWDKGIAKCLLDKTMEMFKVLGTRHTGLFTFSHSTKHVHLYQKYDFWPRFLTAVMTRTIDSKRPTKATMGNMICKKYSDLQDVQRKEALDRCYSLSNSIYGGLDLRIEIESVGNQKLGDTVLLIDNKRGTLAGFAICHCGPGTEAGSNTCYIKFGSVKPNEDSSEATNFENLLDCCEYYATSMGLSKLTAGVNIGNLAAYRTMISKGFKTEFQGVLMTKNNEPGYHVQDIYAIDDWR
jgi:RimJ/RimL family protein N-acetyltransferase